MDQAMTEYHPGDALGRTSILAQIRSPGSPTTATGKLATLRKWEDLHELQQGDYAQRVEHCQMVVNQTDDQLFTWLTSDEAGFELHGKVNSQNVRRYSEMGQGRPDHFVQEKPTVSPKLMVFCGLRKDGTFGLKFWRSPDTITGQVYHSLLQYHVLPEIRDLNGGNLDK